MLSLTGYEKQSLFMRCTGPESYFFLSHRNSTPAVLPGKLRGMTFSFPGRVSRPSS
uniref:Uncharacterized protein n=1 Tax=Klebsiella pneumoniae subsp. pneumoniae TaxID=72407 RepID=A0A8F7KPQ1_KLEPN|nr:hypothetical protein [Klebsiella pneumoniae subsp. pneumoniae]QXV90171.1 hypothetical protein [Klebsiella pneumoniae subsp. pneumoniae]QXV91188.1 hypothetical protein [Klebsiella pneumoniae subsp. pneumoniae]